MKDFDIRDYVNMGAEAFWGKSHSTIFKLLSPEARHKCLIRYIRDEFRKRENGRNT